MNGKQQVTSTTNSNLEPNYAKDINKDDEIDLLEILKVLREHLKLLFFFTFIVKSYYITFFEQMFG